MQRASSNASSQRHACTESTTPAVASRGRRRGAQRGSCTSLRRLTNWLDGGPRRERGSPRGEPSNAADGKESAEEGGGTFAAASSVDRPLSDLDAHSWHARARAPRPGLNAGGEQGVPADPNDRAQMVPR
ncbi:hypothetical protein MRX96_016877 [Rhipicephalus microplus]